MFKDQPCLLLVNAREKNNVLGQVHAVFQVLEQGCHRAPGAAKHPDTADPLGIPLNGNAACPTENGFILGTPPNGEWEGGQGFVQRAVHSAVQAAGISKTAACLTFRHS